jgi:ABC-type uncharacterized transport system involved in gliding motility auxiliary subunit
MQRKHIGSILGVIDIVLFLSSGLTWLIGEPGMAVAKIGLAIVFFAVYIATNLGSLGATASSKGTFFYGVSAVGTLVVVALLGLVNYVVAKNPKTWDLTKNKIHTLSPDTVKTLEGLKQDVTATAFFRTGEPTYEVLHELLERYQSKSPHFKYEFADPIKEPLKAKQFGIKESGPRVVVKLGATESRVQEVTEEALTNAVVKVTHASTKKIYFTSGHGEADPDDSSPAGYSEVKKRMENEGLKAEKLNLASAPEIPQDAQAVVVAGPAKAFQPNEVEALKKFLDAGGKAFLMVEPLTETGLGALLADYNVEADNSMVVDPISRLFGTSEAVPVVQNYGDSEITRDFHLNTVFPTARPLTVLHGQKSQARAQPLALSMPSAWGETNPTGTVRRDENEKGGPLPLVVTVTLDTKAAAGKRSDEARLVVAGDRDFASNKYRNAYGNEDFFLNCMSWLSGQTERITIRPRTREASRLYLTDAQKASIFFFTIDVLPVTLLAVGLSVWLARKSR